MAYCHCKNQHQHCDGLGKELGTLSLISVLVKLQDMQSDSCVDWLLFTVPVLEHLYKITLVSLA